jgi:protein-S-isoprenylcysteine O-methyltransferase Ste14
MPNRSSSEPGDRVDRVDRVDWVDRVDRGHALVVAQALCLTALAWPGPPRWRLPAPLAVLATAAGAAGTVVIEEGVRFLGRDVAPLIERRAGARLQTRGPYAWSRNPIYGGMLVVAAAVAVLRRRPEPVAAVTVLSLALHARTGLEEQRLRRRFGVEYVEYAARTPRLLGLRRPRPDA